MAFLFDAQKKSTNKTIHAFGVNPSPAAVPLEHPCSGPPAPRTRCQSVGVFHPTHMENRRRLNTGFCTLSKVESQVLEKKLQCSQKLHRFFVFACDKWQIFWVSSLMKCHCFPVIPAGSEGMSVLPSIHTLFGMYWIHRSLTSMLNNTLNKAFPNSLLIQSRSWTTF